MQFDILTLFPTQVESMLNESILKRAQEKGIVEIKIHDLRKWTTDARGTADDRPFGGGPGMLMLVEPIYKALKEIGVYPSHDDKTKVLLTSARGETWQQATAQSFAINLERLVLICGHYEGVDHRVIEHLIDGEISIGNYVLTGGELAAAVIVDSISRLIPGALGNENSLLEESHSGELAKSEESQLEYPQYTRPSEFKTEEGETWTVPEILLSGNHAAIKKWQQDNTK